MVKREHSSCRGSEIASQRPYWMLHACLGASVSSSELNWRAAKLKAESLVQSLKNPRSCGSGGRTKERRDT